MECGFTLPSCGVFPRTDAYGRGDAPFAVPTPWQNNDGTTMTVPAGLTADEYYDILPVPPGSSSPQRADGGGGGPADGNCGSGAGGEPLDMEPDPDALDEHGSPIGDRSQGEIAQAASAVARKAQDYARQQGKMSAALKRWADAATRPPTVPWQRKLRKAGRCVTDRLGRGRKSYRRPHRRAICMGAHPRNPLMAVHEHTTCRVWFVLDTSASMSTQDHIDTVSELLGVVRHGEVYILSCDSEVQGEPTKLPRSPTAAARLLDELIKGGGGTDFRPAFAAAEACDTRTRPDLIVFATDGYGPAPERVTIPTIWLITPNGTVPATYGEVVRITA